MKTRQYLFILCVPLFITLLTGCAAQSQLAEERSQTQISFRPDTSMALSAATPASMVVEERLFSEKDALQQEEKGLLDEDLDDWKDNRRYTATVADPLEWYNRAVFQFNNKLMVFLLKPIAKGYRVVTPKPVRTGMSNFFQNLLFPVRFVNCILQGKGQAAEAEMAKFLYNTTVGVLGFGNPSKGNAKLNPDPEDLGQTLGAYGIGAGFYIVWPVLGPSTLRDSVGLAGDTFVNPVTYVDPFEASISLKAYDYLNRYSFRIEDIDAFMEAAFDPYEAARELYIQSRRNHIKR